MSLTTPLQSFGTNNLQSTSDRTIVLQAVTAGSLLWIAVQLLSLVDDAGTVDVSDDVNGAWTPAAAYSTNSTAHNRMRVWYVLAAAAGITTITLHPNGNLFVGAGGCEESISGAVTFNNAHSGNGNSATPSTGLIPVTGANSLVVGGFVSNVGITSVASSYRSIPIYKDATAAIEPIVVTRGMASADTTLSIATQSGQWAAQGASFTFASSGGGGGVGGLMGLRNRGRLG